MHKETLGYLHGLPRDSEATLALIERSASALRDGGEVPLGRDEVAHLRRNSDPAERDLLDQQIALIASVKSLVAELRSAEAGTIDADTLERFEATTSACHDVANRLVLAMQARGEGDLENIVSRDALLTLLAIAISAALLLQTAQSMGSAFGSVREAAK